jgi:hypothetical protein
VRVREEWGRPTRTKVSPFRSPWGLNYPHTRPLLDEFPTGIGDRVPIAISNDNKPRGSMLASSVARLIILLQTILIMIMMTRKGAEREEGRKE